eukprot:TRINITY_DN12138_c0_g1_i1.p1 TRINITY_DN12138_c0_g1~~TRINITY_DN12138_c0_g1_i1.p1  ORF type:complete len:178 (-),score=41.73 TRINITY_DN12138_c0_g1_i1:105-638(-)
MPRRPGSRKRAKVRQPSSTRRINGGRLGTNNEEIRKLWDNRKTIKQNFEKLGLRNDPNDFSKPAENVTTVDLKVPEAAPSQAKKLSQMEVRYYEALIRKFWDDYTAMGRDMKLNTHQKTPRVLKKKCILYWERHASAELNKERKRRNRQAKRKRKREREATNTDNDTPSPKKSKTAS